MTQTNPTAAHPPAIRMAAHLKRGAEARGYADLADLAEHHPDAAIIAHGPAAFALAVSPVPALLTGADSRRPLEDLASAVARRLAILQGNRFTRGQAA